LALTSFGYEGTMSEIAWALLAQMSGTDTAVDGFGGWRVAAGGTGSRAITVQTGAGDGGGVAYGWGVVDRLDAPLNLNATGVVSGTRWDTVVIRRDWQPDGGGTTTVVIVPGGASQALAAGLNASPGVIADQPLALIRITTDTTVQEVVNLRAPASKVKTYPTAAALPAGAPWGQVAFIHNTGDLWMRKRNTAGTTVWENLTSPTWAALTLSSGYQTHPAAGLTGQYRRRMGEVEVRGVISRTIGLPFNGSTNGVVIATLPAGFRPDRNHLFAVAAEYHPGGLTARAEVRTDGSINFWSASSEDHTWLGLDGIRFPAAPVTSEGQNV
jgi:hypothetical protein